MIAIVGTVKKDGVPLAGAFAKIFVQDIPNNIFAVSDVIIADENGKFQYSLWGDLELHDGISDEAKIMIAAWDTGNNIQDAHEHIGTNEISYNGSEIVLIDVNISEPRNDKKLKNPEATVTAGDQFTYTPILVDTDQAGHFNGADVFISQGIESVKFEDGNSFYSTIFNVTGEHIIPFTVRTVGGVEKEFTLTVTVLESEAVIADLVDIDLTSGKAFFVGKDRGIKNNSLEVFLTFSDTIIPTEVRFYSDGALLGTIDDFTSSTAILGVPTPETGKETVIRMETDAVQISDGSEINISYEQSMIHYSQIEGDIAVSLSPETGKHTAIFNFDHEDEIVSVLWQIIYKSVIIEKVIDVSGSEEKGFINILYQNYTTPESNTIEFETLQPGSYVIQAYAINHAGIFFEAKENLFVPGGTQGDNDDLVVGDSVPIGCLSTHGEVPILQVFRLNRENGFVEIESFPMDLAFDKTYFVDYVLDTDNSFYIFKATDTLVIKQVGKPDGIFLAYPKSLGIGKEVPYELQDFNGNVIASGMLDDSGMGAYYKVVSENASGILVVNGTRKIV